MDPMHPDPLVPIVPPVSPGPNPDSPPVPLPSVNPPSVNLPSANEKVVDQDAPGLSVLGEQDGDPVEPNEPA